MCKLGKLPGCCLKNIQSVWAKQPSYLPLASVWQGTSVSVPAGTNWTTGNDRISSEQRTRTEQMQQAYNTCRGVPLKS